MFRSKRSSLVKRLWKLRVSKHESHGAHEKKESSSSSSSGSNTHAHAHTHPVVETPEDLEVKSVAQSMLKRLKETQLDMLVQALESRGGETTECVLLPKGELRLGRRMVAPHVLCCQLFRWPASLKCPSQMKRLACCATKDSDPAYVCCNPYHWSLLLDPEFPPITGVDYQDMDDQSFPRVHKASDGPLQQTVSTETGLTPTHYRQDSCDEVSLSQYYYPSSPPDNNNDNDHNNDDDDDGGGGSGNGGGGGVNGGGGGVGGDNNRGESMRNVTALSDTRLGVEGEGGGGGNNGLHAHHHHLHPLYPPSHTTPPPHPHHHQPQHWCSIAYWELRERVGRKYVVREPSLNVFQRLPHGSGMCLELLQGTTELDSVRKTREKIGLGLILSREGRAVWLYNRSQFPLFVNSPTLEEANCRSLVVWKVSPGFSVRLFDYDRLRLLQRTRDPDLSDGPYDPWSVRVSFAKGWGPCYSRQFITSCPCWVEILLKEIGSS